MQKVYEKIAKMVEKAGKILIISHRQPDADTLGAAIALRLWMGKSSKQVTMACVDRVSDRFMFLPRVGEFVRDFDIEDFDLMVVVDAGASYMTNFQLKYPNFLQSGLPVINIDHHASNDNYGTLNLVDPEAASTTVIIYRFFKDMGLEIDSEMASALLAGIYGDTGSFMHSNTTTEVYQIAADLLAKGAMVSFVSKNLFHRDKVSTLRLWGAALERAKVTDDNVVVSVVCNEDYQRSEARPEQLSGVVEYLSMVPGAKFAVLVNEDQKGNVKGSLRTKQVDIDVSKIAARFGGGGHPKASGFSVPGSLRRDFTYTIVSDDGADKNLNF